MATSDTHSVARLLREYGQRTSLRGGNPYRAKAYLRAADSLAALSLPLDDVIAAGALTAVPGIGDAIADIVIKLQEDFAPICAEYVEALVRLGDAQAKYAGFSS